MRIAVVGASGAGLPAALLLQRKYPTAEVVVIDAAQKVGKKLLATGNGHCNCLNESASPEDYNDPDFVRPFFEKHPISSLEETLFSFGVPLKKIGPLCYPLSFSSAGYVNTLFALAKSEGVRFLLESKVLDYQCFGRVDLWTDKGRESFDHVYFATGGKSGKNLGSDGSLFPVFERHGYEIESMLPGLCPMKTKENVASLSGLRHEAYARLYSNGKLIHAERGEVLFKKDGLSGIVSMNLERFAARLIRENEVTVSLDLFPDVSLDDLAKELAELKKNNPAYQDAFLERPLFEYLSKDGDEPASLAKKAKDLRFSISGIYGFEDSQVTLGGISTSEVDSSLCSKKERGVSFLGEMLDVDGPCGGYNLTWCLLSALIASEGDL